MPSKLNALASALLVGCASQIQSANRPASGKVPSPQAEFRGAGEPEKIEQPEEIIQEEPHLDDLDPLRAESYRLEDQWLKMIYDLRDEKGGKLANKTMLNCDRQVAHHREFEFSDRLKEESGFLEGRKLCESAQSIDFFRNCIHSLVSIFLEADEMKKYYRAQIRSAQGMIPCVKDTIREMNEIDI